MKRIKTVNGYAIYQATTQRDADNYNCEIGCYNLYLSSDIRDFGLSCSYPEYDNIDSLSCALELAHGSSYAVACALADELSDSTIQDMDLVLEIERRLDAGACPDDIRNSYSVFGQCFNDVLPDEDPDLGDELSDYPCDARISHASYAVLRDPDDGQYITLGAPYNESLDTQEKRNDWLLYTVAHHLAFSDCGGWEVDEIVIDGEPIEYIGWQPGMLYEFRSVATGQIVWSASFPQWDH